MKLLILILVCLFPLLLVTANAHENFQSFLEKYETSQLPSQEELQSAKWTYVGIFNDYSLGINKDYSDRYDLNGVKNYDGSQMVWTFDSYEHPLFQFTLSRRNYVSAGRDHLLTQVHYSNNSIAFAFSAYPDGKKNDIYFIQNCRLSSEKLLICPSTLKIKDSSLYPHVPTLLEAQDKVITIQIFRKN